ncbi:hypothetical protein N7468_001417 [Penicillium chermesinum]|uniref:Uncharacterized protein n=1 Tax=Penicillium chermesinum TaxID=63820 RepID=A0A9W9PGR2_9EURO|nr:uncharacterized protein N7468_001417 [Penicillium chermesinum]KAJ5246434.1 hypothetical protein N7468_001417 [Penicillium chermesinum]
MTVHIPEPLAVRPPAAWRTLYDRPPCRNWPLISHDRPGRGAPFTAAPNHHQSHSWPLQSAGLPSPAQLLQADAKDCLPAQSFPSANLRPRDWRPQRSLPGHPLPVTTPSLPS